MPGARACRIVVAVALLALAASSPADAADSAALPAVPRFAIAPSPIGLRGDVRPRQYIGVVGPRSAWLGAETRPSAATGATLSADGAVTVAAIPLPASPQPFARAEVRLRR
jgi:hypothetical protein